MMKVSAAFLILAVVLHLVYLATKRSRSCCNITFLRKICDCLVRIRIAFFIGAIVSSIVGISVGFVCATRYGPITGEIMIRPLGVQCTEDLDANGLARLQAWLEEYLFGEDLPSLTEQTKAGLKYQSQRTTELRLAILTTLSFFTFFDAASLLLFALLHIGRKTKRSVMTTAVI
jgi:hypothetical protein